MRRARNIVAVVLVVAGLSFAQDTGSSQQETIRLLVQQVKELQERVKALEAKPASPSTAAGEALAQPQAVEEAGTTPELHEAGLHELRGIQWRGFGEVNYKVLDQRQPELGTFGFTPGSAGNFYTGDFDLFLTSRINDKTSVLAEIVFGQGEAQSYDVDLERVLLKYDYNDHLKMSFGRYRTGIGYYNTAFHSGKWLQTTADRPLVMEFANDGGLLPTQAIGVSVTGQIPSGRLGLSYLFEYGSSNTVRPDTDGSHVNKGENGNHLNFGLFLRPDAVPGLQVGGSFYHDKMSHIEMDSYVRVGQTIVNGHVIYVAHGFEFLNEAFLIRHTLEHSDTVYNMPAFYSQLSRRFGNIRPFFRYQYANMNPGNAMFEDVWLRHGPSFGARYDFNDNVAFKTQLDHTVREGKPDLNGLQMQLAFTF